MKANKILIKIVAILLCLVLISMSIVSGIFAKFVIEKSGSTTIKFNKFGVSVGLTLSDEFVEFLGGEEKVADMMTVNGDSISINIPNLKMAPGDIWDKAFTVSIDGTPTVDCRFKFDVDLNLDGSKFTIPAGECDFTSDGIYFPARFKVTTPFSSGYYSRTDNLSEDAMAQIFAYYFVYFQDLDNENYCLSRDYPSGGELFFNVSNKGSKGNDSFKSFDLGFEWAFETDALTNQMDTYIVDHNKETGIGFTYVLTLSLEQIG